MQSVAHILQFESTAMENTTQDTVKKPDQTVHSAQGASIVRDGLLAGLILCCAFLLFSHYKTADQDSISNIIVVDFAKIVSGYPAGASIDEVELLMVRTNESILRLRDAGFLVIDSSAVLAAPEYLYLPELDAIDLDDLAESEVEAK